MRGAAFRRGIVPAAALAASLGPAAAQDCAKGKTQLALDQCAGDALAKADAALNLTYRNVSARLGGDEATRKQLVDAQKAWLAFRDAECDFEAAGSRGGSIQPMIVAECRTRLTAARTGTLRGFLTCGEGDMSCPLPPR